MKKLMFAAALVAATTAMADIASSSVVGYNNVKLAGNRMNLITVSFTTVGNANNKATLNDVMDTSVLTPYDVAEGVAKDYVDTWDMENGNWGATYFYVDAPEIEGYADTWVNGELVPVNPEVASGSSMWLYHDGEDIPAFTFAGQIMSGTTGYTLTGGRMNLCGNPYPTVLNLNDKNQVTLTNPTSYDMNAGETRDYIDTWDLTNMNWGPTYFYVDVPELEGYADTWVNGELEPVVSTAIQAGAGFWYYAAGDGTTLTFTKLVD